MDLQKLVGYQTEIKAYKGPNPAPLAPEVVQEVSTPLETRY